MYIAMSKYGGHNTEWKSHIYHHTNAIVFILNAKCKIGRK